MTGPRHQVRTGTSSAEIKRSILGGLYYIHSWVPELGNPPDWDLQAKVAPTVAPAK
jgi:hypothetical protein